MLIAKDSENEEKIKETKLFCNLISQVRFMTVIIFLLIFIYFI